MVSTARQPPSVVALPDTSTAQEGFRALYEAHFAFVSRTLLYFGVAPNLAEDAAQEVFVTLHRRLGDYDGTTPIRSWLWGMCRHVALTERRTSARADRRANGAPPPMASLAPDEALEQKQAVDFIQNFLASLSEEHREVFVMMEIEGMSAPEAALALGEKTNTVYSRLRLAREHFERAGARLRARETRSAG
jgi:RNA polymerase sigma-70 factor (ECF subfamily)